MVIVFSPLIIAGIIIAGIYILFQMPKNKKEYKNSRYYADFQQKFMTGILYSPEYRFYNSAMRKNQTVLNILSITKQFTFFPTLNKLILMKAKKDGSRL